MNRDTPSDKVAALRVYIERALEEAPAPSPDTGTASEDRLLFLGNWQTTMPMLILRHPFLSAEAKVLWGVMKSCADPRTVGALPSHKTLCREIPVESRHTLRAILMELRAARLLSVYQRPRTLLGRFAGHLYLLHDEPLVLADVLHLDPEYLQFLEHARSHARRRVRTLAEAILVTLDRQLDQDSDVLAQSTQLERHAERHAAYQVLDNMTNADSSAMPEDNPFFPVGRAGMNTINLAAGENHGLDIHEQKLPTGSLYQNHREQKTPAARNLPHGQKLPTVETGSGGGIYKNINIKKTTTTTPTPPSPRSPETKTATDKPYLVWPSALTAPERAVCAALLEAIPVEQRQEVLDELEGRIHWGKANGDPLHNRPRWLKKLCDEARNGTFAPALGQAVKAAREKPAQRPIPPRNQPESQLPQDKEKARAALAGLRREVWK